MTQAIVKINNNSLATTGITGFNVSGGSTVYLSLANTSGVSSWSCNCTNTDGYNPNSTVALIQATKTQISMFEYSFVMPAMDGYVGSAVQFTSIANGDPTTLFTCGVFVLNNNGSRLFFPGETYESNITSGICYDLNVRQLAAGVPGPGGTSSLTILTFLTNTAWVCPAGVTFIWAIGVNGGGGGGGGASVSGYYPNPQIAGTGAISPAGSESIPAYLAVVPGNTYNIVVGQGGAGGPGSSASGPTVNNPGIVGSPGTASAILDSSDNNLINFGSSVSGLVRGTWTVGTTGTTTSSLGPFPQYGGGADGGNPGPNGNGGNGGNGGFTINGSMTATNGSDAANNSGASGGGGGSAQTLDTSTSATATSGAGGAGGSGYVVIIY
jgi:hypothetical protein